MCKAIRSVVSKTVAGRLHTKMDDTRTKLSNKIGIAAPRDFGSEWINGRGRSMYGKEPKAPRATTASGLQIRGTQRPIE